MSRSLVRACALAMLTASSAAAQEPAARAPTDAKAIVTIGDTAAPPEWHLNVAVAVNLAPEAEIGRLSARVLYPTKVLKYTKVRATDTLKRAGFDVTAAEPEITGETSSVTLDIKPARRTASALPSGTLAILELKVDAKAPQKSWPITAADIRAWGPLPQAAEVTAAYQGPAKFLVTPPGLPILSCFFYMH